MGRNHGTKPLITLLSVAMASVRARALALGVLLVLALCLTASTAQRQPTNRYISHAGLPRTATAGGKGAGAPRGNVRNLISASAAGRCKDCHGEPPTKASAEITATAESKGTDISHAAPTMTGGEKAAAAVTGAKTAAAGSEGAYMSPAALSEEKRRYISYAALKNNQPKGKCTQRPCA